MIKEIKIENFKSIQSLNLELGQLNVFIGANGSGKSNILEGIALGSAVSEGKGDNEFLAARGIRVVSEAQMKSGFNKLESKILFEFLISGFKYIIPIEYNSKKWVEQKNTNYIDIDSQKIKKEGVAKMLEQKTNNKDIIEAFNLIMDSKTEELDMSKLSTLQLDNIVALGNIAKEINSEKKAYLDFFIFAPENTFLRRFEEETQIKPLGIRGEGLFKEIAEMAVHKPEQFAKINQYLQLFDWFEGFEIPNDLKFTEQRIKIKDQFLEEGLQYIDQRSANEGFLYLLFYLTLFISDDTPKFFAIDNIDNAMNPKLGRELIKLLAQLAKEHGKQVILTTHNPAILDGLNLNDETQRLFVISRNAEGHTKALRIHKDPIVKDKIPVKLSEQFLRGYIGGLNF